MAVLKADAYGMGLKEVARAISGKVDYYGVAYAHEGVSVRKIDALTPILIMVYNKDDIETCIRHNLTMSISSIADLYNVIRVTKGRHCKIHLAVNSGMNRYGFDEIEAFRETIRILNNIPNIELTGVYSHLYDADSGHNRGQIEMFDRYVSVARQNYTRGRFLTHIAASGGIESGINKYDMVRAGISMYVGNDGGYVDTMTLTSTIQSIRRVNIGEFVGYSCNYRAKCDIIIGVVYGGYADGLDRRLSGAEVVIRGERAKIIGAICMDVFFVDITHIHGAKVGDSVTIIGGGNTICDVARHIGCISYELITNLRGRIERSYINA